MKHTRFRICPSDESCIETNWSNETDDYTADVVATVYDLRQASLIAAAPELLAIAEAYRNLLKTMAQTDGEVATYQHICEVLTKARGGSNG